eukprot:140536_1
MTQTIQLYCESCGAVSIDGAVKGGSSSTHQHKFKPYPQSQKSITTVHSVMISSQQKPKQKPKRLWYHGRPGDHRMHFKHSANLLHNQHWDFYESGYPTDHIIRTKYRCDNFKDIPRLAEEKRLVVCLGHSKRTQFHHS